MSNKSRLQTNNINLQELINKAENLPDAGSGGGGGSVETCTVMIMADAPLPPANSIQFTYLDENCQVGELTVEAIDIMAGDVTIRCRINSFILCNQPILSDPGGLSSGGVEAHNLTTLLVRRDGTFIIS